MVVVVGFVLVFRGFWARGEDGLMEQGTSAVSALAKVEPATLHEPTVPAHRAGS